MADDAERRARVAPGTADACAPRVEPWGLFNWLVCSAFFLTLFANRRVAGLAVAHALHAVGAKAGKKFVLLSCAAHDKDSLAGKLFGLDLLAEAPGSAELLKQLNERDSAKRVAADRDAAMEKFLKYARGGK